MQPRLSFGWNKRMDSYWCFHNHASQMLIEFSLKGAEIFWLLRTVKRDRFGRCCCQILYVMSAGELRIMFIALSYATRHAHFPREKCSFFNAPYAVARPCDCLIIPVLGVWCCASDSCHSISFKSSMIQLIVICMLFVDACGVCLMAVLLAE